MFIIVYGGGRSFADHIPEYASGASREVLAAREDGAIVTLLRDTRLQRVFVTATAHLHWDPRWPDVKLLQVRRGAATIICAELSVQTLPAEPETQTPGASRAAPHGGQLAVAHADGICLVWMHVKWVHNCGMRCVTRGMWLQAQILSERVGVFLPPHR